MIAVAFVNVSSAFNVLPLIIKGGGSAAGGGGGRAGGRAVSTNSGGGIMSTFFRKKQHQQKQHKFIMSSSATTTSTSISTSANSYTILDPIDENTITNTNTNTQRDLQKVIETAEKAAYKAGQIMIQTSGDIEICDTKASAGDLVTQSDIECQNVIQETIRSIYPNDYFLGEEDVEAGSFASSTALENALNSNNDDDDNDGGNGDEKGNDKLLWIVDPIDGTTNFQAGLPMFCVSIGVVSLKQDNSNDSNSNNNNEPPQVVAGVIYNPILNEMVTAVRGRGCYVNGKRIQKKNSNDDDSNMSMSTSSSKNNGINLNEAMLNIGFPVYSEGTLRVSSRAVTAFATKVRGLRMIACASQVMSWVAQGKMNAYVSWDLNAWDIAAGMVIVEESGGFISDFDGECASILTRDMIISCDEGDGSGHGLSKAILQVLTENDCLEYQ